MSRGHANNDESSNARPEVLDGRATVLTDPTVLSPDHPEISDQAKVPSDPMSHTPGQSPDDQVTAATDTKASTPDRLGFFHLRLAVRSLDEAEHIRIVTFNRAAATERSEGASKDEAKAIAKSNALVLAYRKIEMDIRRDVRDRARILFPEGVEWANETAGIGEGSVARLLGCVGHPVLAWPCHWEGEGKERVLIQDPEFHRTISQFNAICALGDPKRIRRKGMTVEELFAAGNYRAKKVALNMARATKRQDGGRAKALREEDSPSTTNDTNAIPDASMEDFDEGGDDGPSVLISLTPRRSPYRDEYDMVRLLYADRVHADACAPCHAEVGEPWKDGHQDAAAVRYVAKAILADLYAVAKKAMA